jgi:hypothetical protein
MASDENSHSPPINRLATVTSPIVKPTELGIQVPSSSTIIPMISNPRPSTSSVPSSEKKRSTDNHSEFPSVSNRKQTSVKEIPIGVLRHRLCVRALFYTRL